MVYPFFFLLRKLGDNMFNTEQPISLDDQIVLMKRYVTFRQKRKMRDFLEYAGYFRASRYGKYLLSYVHVFGNRADTKIFLQLYEFDKQLRLLLFKYCKKAEIYFKSALANAVSLKVGDAGFYLDQQYYTPTKSENDKLKRNKNKNYFDNVFFPDLKDREMNLRKNQLKYPELKEYRTGGSRQNNVLPIWAALSYFEFGTVVMMYSYLRGDLRKEILKYAFSQHGYKKETTKQMDTWLDAVRNLRNYCAHHSMIVGLTSSVVIPDKKDDVHVLLNNTNLYSRLYALKKILREQDSKQLAVDLEKLIRKTKLDIYAMDILPANWKELYDNILPL